MPRTNAIALALTLSLALHLLLLLTVPGLQLRYRVTGERLLEVEVAEPEPEAAPPPEPLSPPEPLRPVEPEPPRPLAAAEAEDLSRVLARAAAAAPAPTAPPVRLPRREARWPEPDSLSWNVPLPPAPDAVPRPRLERPGPPAPARREALTGLAAKLLESASAPARPADAPAPASLPRLDIEWQAGVERKVVREPPPPQVSIRNPADVRIQFWVSPRGTVVRTEVLQTADPELDRAALAYVKGLRFNALPADQEQEQWGTIRVRFRLE